MTKRRICFWSGPRNVSTALMYSFAQRPDTKVWDEPLYAHYLKVSGAAHPGRDEVLAQMDQDGHRVSQEMTGCQFDQPILFIKNMAHHLIDLDDSFLTDLENIFLIRDPTEMLPSLVKQIPQPTIRDTGLQRQWELYQQLLVTQDPIIIDAKELLLRPAEMIKELCKELSIPYYSTMLQWKPGALREDGVWSKYWYDQVHTSTGFRPYQKKQEPFPVHLNPLLAESTYYYQKLLDCSLKLIV